MGTAAPSRRGRTVSGAVGAGRVGLTFAAATDRGLVRPTNEDALGVFAADRLFVVADGVGGAAYGEVASRRAVEACGAFVAVLGGRGGPSAREAQALMYGAIECAHSWVEQREGPLMATTLLAARFGAHALVAAAAGDSMLFRLRAGRLKRLDPARGRIDTCWPGSWGTIVPRLVLAPLVAGDTYLLCTDGLSNAVPTRAIERTLRSSQPIAARCAELIARARAAGGPDNITVIVVAVGRDSGARVTTPAPPAHLARNVFTAADAAAVPLRFLRLRLKQHHVDVLDAIARKCGHGTRGDALAFAINARPAGAPADRRRRPPRGQRSLVCLAVAPVVEGWLVAQAVEARCTVDEWVAERLGAWGAMVTSSAVAPHP